MLPGTILTIAPPTMARQEEDVVLGREASHDLPTSVVTREGRGEDVGRGKGVSERGKG